MTAIDHIPATARRWLTERQYNAETWVAVWLLVFAGWEATTGSAGAWAWMLAPVLLLTGLKMNGAFHISPYLRAAGMCGCIATSLAAAVYLAPIGGAVFALAFAGYALQVAGGSCRDARAAWKT